MFFLEYYGIALCMVQILLQRRLLPFSEENADKAWEN